PLVQHLDIIEQVDFRFVQKIGPNVARSAGRGRAPALGRARTLRRHAEVGIESAIHHQKNLSGTTIVSPGRTMSVSFALSSFLSALTIRTILIREVVPRSLTPPASASACSTVVSFCGSAYAPGFFTWPNT